MQKAAPEFLDAAVPRRSEPVPRCGARLHRRDVAHDERVVVDGIAVTHRAASLLDAVLDVGLRAGAELVDASLLRGRVTIDSLRVVQISMSGRPGAETVRQVLALAAGGARFEAERLAHRLLRDAGITGWSANVEVVVRGYGKALLDIAFAEQRVLVEVDGWAYHRDQRAFVRDEARQNALTVMGWTVLRTNWHQLTTDPRAFIDAVQAVVEGRFASGRRHAE